MNFKRADFDAALHHVHLCSEHIAEYDFANLIEYRISKRNLKTTVFPSVQKVPKQTAEHLKQNERICEADFKNNNKIKGPSK